MYSDWKLAAQRDAVVAVEIGGSGVQGVAVDMIGD